MQQEYEITGMTCNGCRIQVETSLSSVSGVDRVMVDLDTEKAEVFGEYSLNNLREALPDKYTIKDSVFHNSETDTEELSKLRQLKPLFLILTYITVSSFLLNAPRESWIGMMPDSMGLFFIVFGFFKMLDLKGFHQSFKMYDPLAARWDVYGKIYPFIETVLGLLFLLRVALPLALIATIVLLGITLFGVSRALLRKDAICCACLGTALKLPMTEATLIENIVMILLSVCSLFLL